MRWLVSLLSLGGGAAAGHLGLRWLDEAARHRAALGPAAAMEHETVLLTVAAYSLLGAMLAGVLGGALAWQERGRTAGTVLLTAGLIPGILDLRAFMITCVLILAGMLGYGLGGRARPLTSRFSLPSG